MLAWVALVALVAVCGLALVGAIREGRREADRVDAAALDAVGGAL